MLVWEGTHEPAELRIKQHKTAHLRGALVRPVPPSLCAIVAASLEREPRPTLFVSPQTHAPFVAEAVYTGWANRELSRRFGKPVTCNIARHAFCTALDTKRMSTAQLEAVAPFMGHSLAQQRAYVRLEGDAAPTTSVQDSSGEYVLPMQAAAAGASEPPPGCETGGDDDVLGAPAATPGA